jgi:transglutaminase-like putative cysteine protease
MELWIASNRHTLSLAEEAYLREAAGGSLPNDLEIHPDTGEAVPVVTRNQRANLNVIEAILDRIIGKTLKLDSGQTERDPVIERLYQLSPGNVKNEIDRLIKNREVILAERKQIEAAKNRRTDEQG